MQATEIAASPIDPLTVMLTVTEAEHTLNGTD